MLAIGSGKKKDLDDLSAPGTTNFPTGDYSEAQPLEKSVKSLGTFGPVLLGAGGALLVGGVLLVVLDRGNKKKGKGAYANVRPGLAGMGAAPLPGGGGAASMSFRF